MKIDLKKMRGKIQYRVKNEYIKIMDDLHLTPKDFSWKVRQRMKYDHNPLYIEVQDKLKSKAYAQERGVKTAEVYYVTSQPETLPFDSLPEKYFIKANHGCAWNILYEERKFYNWISGMALIERDLSKSIVTREESIRLCKKWLKTTYGQAQWAYQHIEPMIMVEEKLEPRDGVALIDYRCFVFDGTVKVINEDSPMYKMGVDLFVDTNWKPFDMPRHFEKPPDPISEKPEKLDEIVRTAEKLGEGFDFIRVDLYDTTKGIVLGEMTIYPEAGHINTPTTDPDFNKWLGDQWVFRNFKVS
jgi:hypothetical protein